MKLFSFLLILLPLTGSSQPACSFWPVFEAGTYTAVIPFANQLSFSFSNPEHLSGNSAYKSMTPGNWFKPAPPAATSTPPNKTAHNPASTGAIGIYPATAGERGLISFSKPLTTGFYLHIYQTVTALVFDQSFTLISSDGDVRTGSTAGLKNNMLIPLVGPAESPDDANATIYFPAGLHKVSFRFGNGPLMMDGIKLAFTFPDDCMADAAVPEAGFEYTITNCNELHIKMTKNQRLKKIKWLIGSTTITGKTVFTHTLPGPGNYNLVLTATGEDGRDIIIRKNVRIKAPEAGFEYSSTNMANELLFQASGRQKLLYLWTFPGNTTSNKKNPRFEFPGSGSWPVKLLIKNMQGCTGELVKNIEIAARDEKTIPITTAAESPAGIPAALAAPLPEQRTNGQQHVVDVSSDTFTIVLYDNAEIDGDTVTIAYNNTIIARQLGLSAKPATYRLKIDTLKAVNELVMFAENLGSIPPNTALLIVLDGHQRHELTLSSNNNANSSVLFRLKRR